MLETCFEESKKTIDLASYIGHYFLFKKTDVFFEDRKYHHKPYLSTIV